MSISLHTLHTHLNIARIVDDNIWNDVNWTDATKFTIGNEAEILAIHETRLISKTHTLQYNNQVVQIMDETMNLHKKRSYCYY